MTKSGITWCLNSDVWASLLCNMLCVREKKKRNMATMKKSGEQRPCIQHMPSYKCINYVS